MDAERRERGPERGGEPVPVVIVSAGDPGRRRRIFWLLVSAAGALALVWLGARARGATIPLFAAFAIAYVLAPLVQRFEGWGIPRTLGIAGLILVFVGACTAGVLLLGPAVWNELARVPGRLDDVLLSVQRWLNDTFGTSISLRPAAAREAVEEHLTGTDTASLVQEGTEILERLYGGTVAATSAVFGLALVPVLAFFFLRDYDRIVGWFRALIPVPYRDGLVARFREVDHAVGHFVRGQFTVAAILAVLYSLGLWAVGVPLAIFVGIVSGLGNMVPYLGTAIGLALATLLVLLDGGGILGLALAYVVFAAVQALEGLLLTPKIVGGYVGLSPAVVLVAILVFGELFGFIGLLLAVPLAAVIKIVGTILLDLYRQSGFYRRG